MQRICLLLVLTLLTALPAQAGAINTIQLHNRPAAEIIPIVEPMLGAGEVITGHGFKLFLRASAQTLEQVEAMIAALDIAAKILQISVFQGSERSLETNSVSGNLRIVTGEGSIAAGNNGARGTGSLSFGNDNVSGDISASSTRQRRQSSPVHQLRVAEGSTGFIETGRQIPFPGVGTSNEYKAVTTGFYILPRVRGERVTLQVSPFRNALSGSGSDTIETSSASTTISGRLGEWLQIGGVSENSSSSQRGIASYASSQGESSDSIWIRADLAR